MGAVASHESHRKELYTVRVGANNKQEFGLVPLTCRYFPTPFTLPFRQLFDARHDGRTMYMYVNQDETGNEIPYYAGSIEGFWARNVAPCDAICKTDNATLLDLLHCRCHSTTPPSCGVDNASSSCSRRYVRPVPCAIIELLDPNKASQQIDADKVAEEHILTAIRECQGLLVEATRHGENNALLQSRLSLLRVEHHTHLMNKYFPLLQDFGHLDVYGNAAHLRSAPQHAQGGEYRYARVVGYLGVRNTIPNAEGNLTGGVFMSKRNNVARLPSLIALASYMYSRQMHLAASQHYPYAASAFSCSSSPSLSSSCSSVVESPGATSSLPVSNAAATSTSSLPRTPLLEAEVHEFISSLAHDLVFDTNVTNVPMLKFITSLPQVLYFILQHEGDVSGSSNNNNSESRSGSASSDVVAATTTTTSSPHSNSLTSCATRTGAKRSLDTSTDSDVGSSATRETLSLMTPQHVAFSHSPGQRKLSCRFSRDLVNRIVMDAGALCSQHHAYQQRQPAAHSLRHSETVEALFDIPNRLSDAMRNEFNTAMGAELSDDRWKCVGEDFGVWRGEAMRYGMVVSPKCLTSSNVMTDALPLIFERNRSAARKASLGHPQWKLLTASHGWWRVRVAVVHRGITPVEWLGNYCEPLEAVNRNSNKDDGAADGRVVEFLLDIGNDIIELHTAEFKAALAGEVMRAEDELRALPDGVPFQQRPLQWRYKGETVVLHIGVDRHCAGGFSRFDPQSDASSLEVSSAMNTETKGVGAPVSIHCVFFNLNLVEQPQPPPVQGAVPPQPQAPERRNGRHQPYSAAVLPKSSGASGQRGEKSSR